MSVEDALMLLRGDVGSEVDLTLRSAEGEFYQLLLTRGLVDPVPDGSGYPGGEDPYRLH
jgi:hypothetical protein